MTRVAGCILKCSVWQHCDHLSPDWHHKLDSCCSCWAVIVGKHPDWLRAARSQQLFTRLTVYSNNQTEMFDFQMTASFVYRQVHVSA